MLLPAEAPSALRLNPCQAAPPLAKQGPGAKAR